MGEKNKKNKIENPRFNWQTLLGARVDHAIIAQSTKHPKTFKPSFLFTLFVAKRLFSSAMACETPYIPPLFVSHGGGPAFFLKGSSGMMNDMGAGSKVVNDYKQMSKLLPKPKAILVISAHWEESTLEITTNPKPTLLYDYYGFPKESYAIKYEVPHSSELVERVHELLDIAKIPLRDNPNRGLDHGTFIPLKLIYPETEKIPVVQLSLSSTLDPAYHIRLGRALSPLANEGYLIFASGMITHNMSLFFAPYSSKNQAAVDSFVEWTQDTLTNPELSEATREQRLSAWTSAPNARYIHPREEHWIPIMVAYGAAAHRAPAVLINDWVAESNPVVRMQSYKFE